MGDEQKSKEDNKEFMFGWQTGFFVAMGFIICVAFIQQCDSTLSCFKTCYPLQYKMCNNNLVMCADKNIKLKK